MKPYGKGRKGVLVVGEAPGELEDSKGRPFIGKAGQFLRRTLEQIDVDLDKDAVTTNALICRPPGNKTPDAKQILYCRPNVLNAIREHEPQVVVTLGRSALASVLEGVWKDDVGALERWVGWQMPLADYWLCPTYHPSYLLRSKDQVLDRLFLEHLDAAFSLQKPPPEVEDLSAQIKILFEEDEIAKGIEALGEVVVMDYETNCAKSDWPDGRIVSCALCDGEQTISFPWSVGIEEAMSGFLFSSRYKKVAHNLKFEERWTRRWFGRGVKGWLWDTMLAAHCLDNRTGICSLKFQSLVRLGVPSYNEHIAPYLENKRGSPYNRIEEVGVEQLLLYGGMDALLEWKLFNLQTWDMAQ